MDAPPWPRGKWACFLCGQVGVGGAAGFNRHYIARHYNEER